MVFAPAASAAESSSSGVPWTALHQWTPLAATITVVRKFEDRVSNVSAAWRILHLTDAHISLAEAQELHPYGTRRMHEAFRSADDKHWQPGARRAPADTLRGLLGLAAEAGVDAVVLGGDIVNFPHNASVQYVVRELRALRRAAEASRASCPGAGARACPGARLPVLFVAGNHDWMVEALAEKTDAQRSRFRQQVLRPLYRLGQPRASQGRPGGDDGDGPAGGARPWGSMEGDFGSLELQRPSLSSCSGVDCEGGCNSSGAASGASEEARKLLILAVDNSLHEVNSAQAKFVWKELERGLPTVLVVHVPFMLPGVTPHDTKEVLCGDPRFGHDSDTAWRVERRDRWPRTGASATTRQFVQDLIHKFAAPRGPLLAVLGGHEHLHRADAAGVRRPQPLQLRCVPGEARPGAFTPPRCSHNSDAKVGVPMHEGFVQYVTQPAFAGGHRIVEVRDARSSVVASRCEL